MTTAQVARSEGLHQFGNVRTDYFMTNAVLATHVLRTERDQVRTL